MDINELLASPLLLFPLIVKAIIIVLSLLYLVYALVLLKQTRVMTRTIDEEGGAIFILISFIQVIVAFILVALSFVMI